MSSCCAACAAERRKNPCNPCEAARAMAQRRYEFRDRDGTYTWSHTELDDTLFESANWDSDAMRKRIEHLEIGGKIRGKDGTLTRIANAARAANPKRACAPADTDACALGKWAWDQPMSACGESDLPADPQEAASEAGRNLARKGWEVRHAPASGGKRVAASRLRNPYDPHEALAARLARGRC